MMSDHTQAEAEDLLKLHFELRQIPIQTLPIEMTDPQ
jgi:hypothetical protein